MIETEEDIIHVIQDDVWMMDLLKAVKTLDLPDWWICAGFVRSKVWDTLHNFLSRTPLPDVDVIYYDASNLDETVEKVLEEELRMRLPNVPWSVKNQARMHVVSDFPPYTSSVDGIAHFPETVTALGVKLDENDAFQLIAPWGVGDVIKLQVNPTSYYTGSKERMKIYENRMTKKDWTLTWHKVKIFYDDSIRSKEEQK
jgi:hypothetical protein